jgi:hypothetical protein
VSGDEFQIRITGDEVRGLFIPQWRDEGGGEPEGKKTVHLSVDPLTLRTSTALARLLHIWDVMEESREEAPTGGIRRAAFQPETLEVLGTHLWNLILDNDVGEFLRANIPPARAPALRVLIEFTDKAPLELRALPWEFLYDPRTGGFLSTMTELMLTRYVTYDTEGRVAIEARPGDQLRVMLVDGLPDTDEFAAQWRQLSRLKARLEGPGLDVIGPIPSEDEEAIKRHLDDPDKPVHIVHLVGICKGDPGKPKVYRGRRGDPFEEPSSLVDRLTTGATLPQLVILQLCDFVDGDATENFERLAPDLIRRRVPAVLALQLPARVDQADQVGLGKKFYASLVAGKTVGQAVQESRHDLKDNRDRSFGTPVLYLQEDGVLFRPGPSGKEGTSGTGGVETGGPRRAWSDSDVRKALAKVLTEARLDAADRDAILTWLFELDVQGGGLARAKELVQAQHHDSRVPAQKQVYQQMLTRLTKLSEEAGRGTG